MNFWITAVALLVIAALAFSWPLFGGTARDRFASILILLGMPLIGLSLYQVVGTPDALGIPVAKPQTQAQAQLPHAESGGEIDMLLQQLQQRLAENPNDPEGWVVLGRTLKAQQRYAEAEAALTNANNQMPDTPTVMVELAEAKLFASGRPVITTEIRQLLETAIDIDPHQQKGLWLLGMAQSEEGDFAGAISTWQSLLGLLEPGSGSHDRVTEQITEAHAMLGESGAQAMAAAETPAPEKPAGPVTVAESGIPVTITVDGALAGSVPGNAVLFVFVHPAGGAGMPLAVKRLAARGFPMSLNFTDADLLQPGNSLQNFEQLDVSARISQSGSVSTTPGDVQANRVTVDTQAVEPVALHLDQRIP